MSIFYVDGQFVPAQQAQIPVDDLAILRGYGVFDFMRTYQGHPIFLREHVLRLENSAREIGLDFPWSREEVADLVWQTLKRNPHSESNIRIVITGGSSQDFITPQGNPRLLILVTPLVAPPDHWYSDGVKIITVAMKRSFPRAKSIDYIAATIALKQARRQGAVEAVYVDPRGCVLEGTTSNLFLFLGEKLVTPDEGVLSGITRKVILEIARQQFPIELRDVQRQELLSADEVFISASNKGLVPVVRVDESMIGSGKPGERSRALIKAMTEYTSRLAARR